jgi:hypothetical protein
LVTALVLRDPSRPPARAGSASSTSTPQPTRYLPRLGGIACDDPGGCIYSPSHVPTAGVAAALRERFPSATEVHAQLLIEPGTGHVRSQYVTALAPSRLRVTVAVSYDGDEFRTDGTYHRDFDRPPTMYFDRHSFEGWSIEVTVGGTVSAQGYRQQGFALMRDGRLLS